MLVNLDKSDIPELPVGCRLEDSYQIIMRVLSSIEGKSVRKQFQL